MTKDQKGTPVPTQKEVVVVMRPEAALRASAGRFESVAGADVGDMATVMKKFKAKLTPLFGATEERVAADTDREASAAEAEMPDLSVFYSVEIDEKKGEDFVEEISKLELVDAAYVKPGAEPPIMNDMVADADEAPPSTPDFTARQDYLDAAPAGIDARWAWTRGGGRGQNVRIIDIEGAWRFTHEDLTQFQGGVVGGTQSSSLLWRNHGTAVLGEYSGDHNGFGVSGICDRATASAVSIFGAGQSSSQALRQATNRLRAGDIILIELHRPGPRHNFQGRNDQRGYIAIEWWEDDFAAIRAATQRGIIVVEAAGNGAENLDDAIYQTRPSNFPSTWTNPFRRANRDSGAIMVGAGAPPPGTHGRNHGPDRSRLDFSNYGALIDAQGWGREVTTCGYGDLQGGSDEDLWYTDTFSGTSSASPIVVGAIGCIQGMARAMGRPVLSPARVRRCLRTTGSPQQDAPGRPRTQRIGNRPNIRAFYNCAFRRVIKGIKEKDAIVDKRIKEIEKFKDIKDFKEKDRKEFKEKDIKDRKEKDAKEFKEKDKDIFEDFQIRRRFSPDFDYDPNAGGIDQGQDGGAGADADQNARLAALEMAVTQLSHFITGEMRPDVGGYSDEDDAPFDDYDDE